MTIHLKVGKDFLAHRAEKFEQYNQRGRTDRKFLMDLDAELLEFDMIKTGHWQAHDSWMVDAINAAGNKIDVKFIRKYWNVSREKTLNLIKQRDILDGYSFFEWVGRPARPFRAGDEITVNRIGYLSYAEVADNLRKSFKEPDGFYVAVHSLIRCR